MKRTILTLAALALAVAASAQIIPVTYFQYGPDARAVEDFELPDLLTTSKGKQVRNRRQWERRRRPELLSIFETEMYGKVPEAPAGLHFARICPDSLVFDGAAVRSRVRVWLDADEQHHFDMLVHMPAAPEGKVPMFVGLNFHDIDGCLELNHNHIWPFELLVREGFGVAVAFHSSIELDSRDNDPSTESANVRSWYRPAEEWGAISAWAWGISRMIDWFETVPEIDMDRIAVIGHSRLGKTALWASANDKRISMAVSNNSGCCGAAISRRMYGETFDVIGRAFPYWFVPRFQDYAGKEAEFPTDQHALIALSAPRPVYVASADMDDWADPLGEWRAAYEAGAVYKLYGLRGLSRSSLQPSGHCDDYGSVAYKIRPGGHGLWPDDWYDYIKYAKRVFGLE